MGIRGNGNFSPSADFHFPRSFITDVVVFDNGVNYSQSGNIFTLDLAPSNPIVFTLAFQPNFWSWNSNDWTIDYVILDSYYKLTPSSPPVALDYSLRWGRSPAGTVSTLFLGLGPAPSGPHRVTLAGAPSSYWSPPT
jgi:hypothetical protein